MNHRGKTKGLGYFATAEEAALAFARAHKEKKLAEGKPLHCPTPLTKAEAVQLAREEGLTLERVKTTSGYKGVRFNNGAKRIKHFEAISWQGGKRRQLGSFETAEEAASWSRELTGRGGTQRQTQRCSRSRHCSSRKTRD